MSAQRELWGISKGYDSFDPEFPDNYGNIFKVNIDGQNKTVMHEFNSANGKFPDGRILLASDGKIYGTTTDGGVTAANPNFGYGVLYQYDLEIDQFRVVQFFNGDPPYIANPGSGLIETSPGTLFGTTIAPGKIYKYNVATELVTFSANVPNFNSGGLVTQNEITGELFKASNGMLYGTSKRYSSCLNAQPFLGSIVRLNPTNNAFSYIHPFNCSITGGMTPNGSLVDGTPGKLYGTTYLGGDNGYENSGYGNGVLFEYDFIANTYTKKFDFDAQTTGTAAGPLINGGNGKLYGVLGAGNGIRGSENYYGALYEYDIQTNTLNILKHFGTEVPSIAWPKGKLLKASDGNLYGVCQTGIFKYDFTTSEVTLITLSAYADEITSIIEICRKPSYYEFTVDTFTPCVDTPFSFDLQNTNATSYTWRKNGTIIPSQSTGILMFTNVTTSDNGDYACEMVNECGTTITMTLHINVGCLGLNGMAVYNDKITLYPNPANTIVNLNLPKNETLKKMSCAIYNVLGQTVYENKFQSQQIDVRSFPSGIYNINIKTDKWNWFGKFVKQ